MKKNSYDITIEYIGGGTEALFVESRTATEAVIEAMKITARKQRALSVYKTVRVLTVKVVMVDDAPDGKPLVEIL